MSGNWPIKRYKKGIVINGDCSRVLRQVRERSCDLVVADPPFNIGIKYDTYDDIRTSTEYNQFTRNWASQCGRVLKDNGSIFVCIGDREVADVKLILDSFGFNMRAWIIWHYTFGVYCGSTFGRGHTHILYYTKSQDWKWYGDAIRVPSARQTKYNDKRANPKGRVPCDVWTFPRVCGTFKERNKFNHPCQMPEAIVDRMIKATTKKNDVVLDPFAGSGTTLASAMRLKRRFLGIEISHDYFNGINHRLKGIK